MMSDTAAPHVTLGVNPGFEAKDIGPMVKRMMQQQYLPTNIPGLLNGICPTDWFLSLDLKTPVRMEKHTLEVEAMMTLTEEQEEYLQDVPKELWAEGGHDIGLMRSAGQVKIQLKPGMMGPRVRQYPLNKDAEEGINTTIQELLKAGVIYPTTSPCNTPILPVKKAGGKWRMVQDLRPLNSQVIADYPIVPDPSTILTNIPSDTTHTVINLCSAFFSIPVHPDSQYLFAFTYRGQQYTYQRLPQGYVESPSLFNQMVRNDLADFAPKGGSTLIQYVDDLLLCSPNMTACKEDSKKLLQELTLKGHKVSKSKLQFCQEQVQYLGHTLKEGSKSISAERIEAITKVPRPRTVKEMQRFLGMTGYCRQWICDYAEMARPLRDLCLNKAGRHQIEWLSGTESAFTGLKQALQTAPTLGLPDYNKQFHLFCAEKGGFATAVLTQKEQERNKPIAYYSTRLDTVARGLHTCEKGLAAAAFAVEKATPITAGHEVTLYVSHAVEALLSRGKSSLTYRRVSGYEILLTQPGLTIIRCKAVNPAELMMTPEEGQPHECERVVESEARAREDLQQEPLMAPDHVLFVDGSSSIDPQTGKRRAGYAVIRQEGPWTYQTIEESALNPGTSAQQAELIALARACRRSAGLKVNIYCDSAYACGVVHSFGGIWARRGFLTAGGNPIKHIVEIKELLEAMKQPKKIAIIKCAAHTGGTDPVSAGNDYADKAAKLAAEELEYWPTADQQVLLNVEEVALQDLIEAQEASTESEKVDWENRGCGLDKSTGIWRQLCTGKVIAPNAIIEVICRAAHGVGHSARGEMMREIQKHWFIPKLTEYVTSMILRCKICQEVNKKKGIPTTPGSMPPPVGPFTHLVMDYVDMIDRAEGKRYCLVIIDRFSRWVEAFPTAHADSKTVAKALAREIFPRFGVCQTLSCDNGSHFTSDMIADVCKMTGIQQKFSCVYHPQAAGIVERCNGTLKTKLQKICRQTGMNWVQGLPLALMAMRNSRNRFTHLTPHEMVTGRVMPMPTVRPESREIGLEALEEELHKYLKGLTQAVRSVYSQAKEAQGPAVEDPELLVNPGEWVYVKKFKRKWKQPRQTGPYQVILATPTAVKLKEIGPWVHLNHCRRAQEPEAKKEPKKKEGEE
ncbi:hypothetical protein SKAU_G00325210 [Synaphobranchus kaupii]|uniref:Gypsy retrotransposon integrase-like protein 1 n=1 Tax=Synaphobranchus kaupii TaxID=118154 RepID=A0A9Q1EPG6_SYNKA|nr:hypothetical protein SKAU_G00325210 [Synaphobranchus kaupii]